MYEKTCVKLTQSDRSPRSILRSQVNYKYDKGSGVGRILEEPIGGSVLIRLNLRMLQLVWNCFTW